jgi:hypothetical protein
MATMTTADGKKLALKAPFPLPKPTLNGDRALYKSVLPDVDLELTATPVGGWRQVLIVHTAAAAANPAVGRVQLDVDADGLTMSADGNGNLRAVDAQGRTRFSAPAPVMWDSAGSTSQAKATGARTAQSAPAPEPSAETRVASSPDGPGAGAVVKPIATTVNAQGIQLVPDAALLAQGTGPWYIDPGLNPDAFNGTQAWAQVQEAHEDTNGYNGSVYGQDKPAAGFCGYADCQPGRERAGGLIASQDGAKNSAFTLYADPANGNWRFALARADDGGWPYDWSDAVNEAARFTPGVWTRLTAVYNAGTGLMSLYVNGTLAASGQHAAATGPAPAGPLVMGRYQAGAKPDYFGGFTGGISNLAVYPYAVPPVAPDTISKIALSDRKGMCLDNERGGTADGNRIQVWECNEISGGAAQKFEIRTDGTIRTAGKCLDATSAGTANGTPIQLATCHDHPAQQFLPRADGSLYNPVSGRCVDASDMVNGIQPYLWECNRTNPQRWTIPTLNTAPLPVPVP